MKNIKCALLLTTVILMLLISACSGSSVASTVTPTQDLTSLPPTSGTDTTATAATSIAETPTLATTDTVVPTQVVETATPAVSVTAGVGPVVSIMCEFCVDTAAYTVLVIPRDTTFVMPTDTPANAGLNCFVTDAPNGKQVVVCYGLEPITFNLQVCDINNNCVDFPVTLQDCSFALPNSSSTPGAGSGNTATSTSAAGSGSTATNTATTDGRTATATPPALSTFTPTPAPPVSDTPIATP